MVVYRLDKPRKGHILTITPGEFPGNRREGCIMFNFTVFHPGMMFGRPELHAILECEGVSYCVMFGQMGDVYSGVGVN